MEGFKMMGFGIDMFEHLCLHQSKKNCIQLGKSEGPSQIF
jgi:hypothetical protein